MSISYESAKTAKVSVKRIKEALSRGKAVYTTSLNSGEYVRITQVKRISEYCYRGLELNSGLWSDINPNNADIK